MPELQISPEKVAWVILRAREFESKVSAFDDGDSETADESDGAILENRKADPTLQELHGFFDTLNVDEEADLVTIAWIGRGTYSAEEWNEARNTALAERSTRTERYLLGMPMLADHLENGLAELGIDVAEEEEEIR
jgi:hypothetical protein